MDGVESWSRTRRASAHSIGLSSRSNSISSSAGPSSFTENLTFYMNEKEETGAQNTSFVPKEQSQDLTSSLSGKRLMKELSSIRAFDTDLRKPLRNSPQSQRNGFSNGIKSVRLDNDFPNSDSCSVNFHHEASDLGGRFTQEESLNMHLSSKSFSHTEPLQNFEKLEGSKEKSRSQERVDHSMNIQSAPVEKLQAERARQARSLDLPQPGIVDENVESLQAEARINTGEQSRNDRDELDDQSLIEELEDDLERTRHELHRIIKDRKRTERQLQGTQADLEYERQRNKELEELLAKARASVSLINASHSPAITVHSKNMGSAEMMYDLKSALDKACVKIDLLEERLLERDHDKFKYDDKRSPAILPQEAIRLRANNSLISIDKAETYIRKIKAQNRLLNEALGEARMEGEALEKRVQEDENVIQNITAEVQDLKAKMSELEATRDRMARVLMYQWGKEEVGQIERRGLDGKTELGMGFRYRYYKKDGTVR